MSLNIQSYLSGERPPQHPTLGHTTSRDTCNHKEHITLIHSGGRCHVGGVRWPTLAASLVKADLCHMKHPRIKSGFRTIRLYEVTFTSHCISYIPNTVLSLPLRSIAKDWEEKANTTGHQSKTNLFLGRTDIFHFT